MLLLPHLRPLGKALLTFLLVVFLQPIMAAGCMSDAIMEPDSSQLVFASTWRNVAIGGGGYVTGIYLHPQEPTLVYIRTDTGGFFRWNEGDQQWKALTDHFPPQQLNYYGGEALALDPNNPDLVYIATGKYVSVGPGALFKSTDRGETWVKSNLEVPMGGDQNKRWAGNRLAVSPHNPNLLLFGSRTSGLWRSLDAGITWSQVTSLNVAPDPEEIGILSVVFDPQQPGNLYASIYEDAIYQSTDNGDTWIRLTSSPSMAMRMAVASDRTLYVTSATSPGVSKFQNGIWYNITPPGDVDSVFNGLSLDPRNSERLLVSVGETGSPNIYLSLDAGETWTKQEYRGNSTVSWMPDNWFADHASSIEFDLQDSNQAWLTDWFGVWRTEGITAKPAVWINYPNGHEQTVALSLLAPPTGSVLLSGMADIEGFRHTQLDEYPTSRLGYKKLLGNDYLQDTYSIAYCFNKPQHLVRVGGYRWSSHYTGLTSDDEGLTWKRFAIFPGDTIPLRVAISANDPETFVITVSGGQALRTNNNGRSWQQVMGLPDGVSSIWNWTQPLASDGVNGNRFYYYADGIFYRSDNGGASFSPVNSSLPEDDWHIVETIPSAENEVWVALKEFGIYRSTDGGKTFSKLAGVEKASLLSFGKPKEGSIVPSLYLYGSIKDEGEGMFLSLDWGRSWYSLTDQLAPIATEPLVLEASTQHYGLVFVGTNGRGIYYRDVSQQF